MFPLDYFTGLLPIEKFRTPVKMESVPKDFVHAILAAEDDRFLQHRGVDIAGLLRAAAELLRSGKIRTGGSTITMQVARNFFLSSEQTFIRKFNEIFLALKIERLLSKDEILELYVNKIYLGKRAYGVQAAAAIYYGKSIEELSLASSGARDTYQTTPVINFLLLHPLLLRTHRHRNRGHLP